MTKCASRAGDVDVEEVKPVTALALDIRAAFREQKRVRWLGQMVAQWVKQQIEQVERAVEWRRRRREFTAALWGAGDAAALRGYDCGRLRDRDAGPPGENWRWEALASPIAAQGERLVRLVIESWVPPDVSVECEPAVQLPLPLPAGPLSIEEAAAALAAVHDAHARGQAWLGLPVAGQADGGGEHHLWYGELVSRAEVIGPDDVPHLRCLLNDMLGVLAGSNAWVVDPSGREGGLRPSGRRRRKLAYDPAEDRRVAEAWNTGTHSRRADLARELGRATDDVVRAIDRHRKRNRGSRARRNRDDR